MAQGIRIFYAKNIAGGANTVTATFSATNNHPWMAIYEYSGLSTTAPLDQTKGAQGSSASPNTGAVITSNPNELIFVGTGTPATLYTGTFNPGTGYTLRQQNVGASQSAHAATEDQVVSSSGSYSGTFSLTSSTDWSAVMATFVAPSSNQDCWGQSYTYDRYANLTNVAVTKCTAPSLNLSVNPSTNRVTNTGYSYDTSGNVTSDGTFTYTWNAEGLMSSAAGVTYTYDGDNKRLAKSSGKMYWYGASGRVIAESDLSGNIVSEYMYFGAQRIARRDLPSGNVFYYAADRLGSSRMIVNSNGGNVQPANGVVWASDFYPYGGERAIVNTISPDNTYKFTGHERDSETGLDHTDYRQYSSNTGRWLSADSLRGTSGSPQSWNRYGYVRGDVTDLTDPDGFSEVLGQVLLLPVSPYLLLRQLDQWHHPTRNARCCGWSARPGRLCQVLRQPSRHWNSNSIPIRYQTR